jgi:hypothetical protein
MGVVLSIAAGMILWVVLWALGAKGFDGGMLFLIVVLVGGIVHLVSRLLPGNQDQTQANPDAAPFN